MNVRTLVLILAVGLVGIGLVMTIAGFFQEAPPEQTVQVARAQREIPPYTIITSDMLRLGDPIRARDARDQGAYPFEAVEGKMTTQRLAPGDLMTTRNALPPEDVRFTEDLNLEIVSFAASAEQMVGGKIRPGHIVNLYGTGQDEDNVDFTVLIEPRLWVVGVSAGGNIVEQVTAQADLGSGEVIYTQDGPGRPATLLTVAVEPSRVFNIIDSLSARGLAPYVTLASSQDPIAASLATPVPLATETPGLSLELSLTATALFLQLQATQPPPMPPTGGGGVRR